MASTKNENLIWTDKLFTGEESEEEVLKFLGIPNEGQSGRFQFVRDENDILYLVPNRHLQWSPNKPIVKIKFKHQGSDENAESKELSQNKFNLIWGYKYPCGEISVGQNLSYLWKFEDGDDSKDILEKIDYGSWYNQNNLPTQVSKTTAEELTEDIIINDISCPANWMKKLGGIVNVPLYYIKASTNKQGVISGSQLKAFSYKNNRNISTEKSGQYFIQNWTTADGKPIGSSQFWSLYPQIYPEVVWNELDGTDSWRGLQSDAPAWTKTDTQLSRTFSTEKWNLEKNDLVVVYRRTKGDIEPKSQISNGHLWTAFPLRGLSRSREIKELTCEFDLTFDKEIECYEMPKYAKLDGSNSSLNYQYFTEDNRLSYNNNSFLDISEKRSLTLKNTYTTSSQDAKEKSGKEWCFQIGVWDGVINPIKKGDCKIDFITNIKSLPIIQTPNSKLKDVIIDGNATSTVSFKDNLDYGGVGYDWSSSINVYLSAMPGTLPEVFPLFKDLDEVQQTHQDGITTEIAYINNLIEGNEFIYKSNVTSYEYYGVMRCNLDIKMASKINLYDTYAYAVVIWRNGKLALQ